MNEKHATDDALKPVDLDGRRAGSAPSSVVSMRGYRGVVGAVDRSGSGVVVVVVVGGDWTAANRPAPSVVGGCNGGFYLPRNG